METQTRIVPYAKERAEWKTWLVLFMCFTYIVQFLTGSYVLMLLLGGMAVFVFFTSLPAAKAIPRYFSLVMFMTGMILNLWKGDGWEGIIRGIATNLPLLTLVILVPLLSVPLKLGGYLSSIHYYMERLGAHPRRMFGSISLFLFCLGPILNLGSIRVLHEMIQDLKFDSKFLAKAYLVGFSTVILWSPYFASVAMVLYYLHVPIFDFLPLGLTLAAIQLTMGNLLFWLGSGKSQAIQESALRSADRKENRGHRMKMWKLLSILILIMGTIFLMAFLTGWPMLFLVSLVSVFFPVLWCTVFRQWRDFRPYFHDFKRYSVPAMNNEIVLFMSAGLFGKALVGTAFAHGIRTFLNETASASFMLFVIAIFAIIIVTTFIGIHQIVTVTVLITQLDPAVIGVEPRVLALLFMTAWSLTSVLSPVNPLNILVSGSVREPALHVGLKWNGVYLASMFFIGSIYVYLLH